MASAALSEQILQQATLSQGQVQVSWQAQHSRKLRYMVASAAPLEQILQQAKHFRKVRHRFRGRRSACARSGTACQSRGRCLLAASALAALGMTGQLPKSPKPPASS